MIHYEHDKDLFDFHVDALVNTVNCVGVMGKGLALQFKQRFPQNFKTYKKECDASNVKIGQMLIHDNGFIETPRFIINFPTKQHWRSASKIEYIEAGLKDLKECIKKNGIKSIVIPPLGCGNGGLNWKDVRSLIEEAFSAEDIDLYILEPTNKFTELKTKEDVDLTPFRAVFLKTVQIYNNGLSSLGNIEIQKIVYFINLFMNNTRLHFIKHTYGPYCRNLHNSIDLLAHKFLAGLKDGTENNQISLRPGAEKEIDAYIADKPELKDILSKVQSLIEGYESPFGMELLATVHFVVAQENASNLDGVIEHVHAWNARKKNLMKPEYIARAFNRLKECALI